MNQINSIKKVGQNTAFILFYLLTGFIFLTFINACSTNKPVDREQKNSVELLESNVGEIYLVGTEEFRKHFFGKGHKTVLK